MAIVRFDPFRGPREFDRLANQFLGLAASEKQTTAFAPAYDLEQHGDDTYVIHLALPGVTESQIELTAHEGVLTVSSKAIEPSDSETSEDRPRALHRGIGRGNFERIFRLAKHVEVTEARLAHGLLTIKLVRQVPDALKPRVIEIATESVPAANDATPAVEAA